MKIVKRLVLTSIIAVIFICQSCFGQSPCPFDWNSVWSPNTITHDDAKYTFSNNIQFFKTDGLSQSKEGYLEMTLKEDLPSGINRIELFIRDDRNDRNREYWMYIDFRTNMITYRYDVNQVIKRESITADAKKAGTKYRFELLKESVNLGYSGGSSHDFDNATYPINEERFLWIAVGGIGTVNLEFNSDFQCLSTSLPPELELISDIKLFPNPIKTAGTLQILLEEDTRLFINLFNLEGRLVKTIENNRFRQGIHTIALPKGDLPSGTYLVSVSGRNGQVVKKVVFID
ncbi:MAG: T9SS type A sorting domain-containing protein [Bacteroidota bacterium]